MHSQNCGPRYFIVCNHVSDEGATPLVEHARDGKCDGSILCAACDITARIPNRTTVLPVCRVCSDCSRVFMREENEVPRA